MFFSAGLSSCFSCIAPIQFISGSIVESANSCIRALGLDSLVIKERMNKNTPTYTTPTCARFSRFEMHGTPSALLYRLIQSSNSPRQVKELLVTQPTCPC